MKITRSQLKRIIKEELEQRITNLANPAMEEAEAYPTSDGTIAGALAEELDEIKNSFKRTIHRSVRVMLSELNKPLLADSDENLVMDALQRFDDAARSYDNEVAVSMRNAEINDGSEAPNAESASEILANMVGEEGIDALIDRFDSILAGRNYNTMLQIINSNQ